MALHDILMPTCVFADVHASGKKQALQLIANLAEQTLQLNRAEILHGLKEREALSSTGVGSGVAIPHARLPNLSKIHGMFLRFASAFPFAAIDDVPVDLVFVLLAPIDAGASHLIALAEVSRTLRRPEMRRRLRAAPDAAACLGILNNQ